MCWWMCFFYWFTVLHIFGGLPSWTRYSRPPILVDVSNMLFEYVVGLIMYELIGLTKIIFFYKFQAAACVPLRFQRSMVELLWCLLLSQPEATNQPTPCVSIRRVISTDVCEYIRQIGIRKAIPEERRQCAEKSTTTTCEPQRLWGLSVPVHNNIYIFSADVCEMQTRHCDRLFWW